ncbi:hypothetical protein I316_00843 [Kwoniella heveanensis BCC8398]|uniref:Uncharacterized protein n=1 Tax=Kwoniella heveanensis BCC8398 TaxID=1296120 RepID=A0A1B9H367_9TREE|nr:hypothetical protein I316_00843 [Kwoniella heveanensis BCC8398]
MTDPTSSLADGSAELSTTDSDVFVCHPQYKRNPLGPQRHALWEYTPASIVDEMEQSPADPKLPSTDNLYMIHCDALATQISRAWLESKRLSEERLERLCMSPAGSSAFTELQDSDEIRHAVDDTVMDLYRKISIAMTEEGKTVDHFINSLRTLETKVVPGGALTVENRTRNVTEISENVVRKRPARHGETRTSLLDVYSRFIESIPLKPEDRQTNPTDIGSEDHRSIISVSQPPRGPWGFHTKVKLPTSEFPFSLRERVHLAEKTRIASTAERLAAEAVSMLKPTTDSETGLIVRRAGESARSQFWDVWNSTDWSQVRPTAQRVLNEAFTDLIKINVDLRVVDGIVGKGYMDNLSVIGIVDPLYIETISRSCSSDKQGFGCNAISSVLKSTDGYLPAGSRTGVYPSRKMDLNAKKYLIRPSQPFHSS